MRLRMRIHSVRDTKPQQYRRDCRKTTRSAEWCVVGRTTRKLKDVAVTCFKRWGYWLCTVVHFFAGYFHKLKSEAKEKRTSNSINLIMEYCTCYIILTKQI